MEVSERLAAMEAQQRRILEARRQAILFELDKIERELGTVPRTADLRHEAKERRRAA